MPEKTYQVMEYGYREKPDKVVFEGTEDDVVAYMDDVEDAGKLVIEDEDGKEYMISPDGKLVEA